MVFIFETNLPGDKSIINCLALIYGIGRKRSRFICRKLGLSKNVRINELKHQQLKDLTKFLTVLNFKVDKELKKFETLTFQKLLSIKSRRGLRRVIGLPVRGQRTRTNAKSSRKK